LLKYVFCVGLTGLVSVAFEDNYATVNEDSPIQSPTKT